GDIAQCYSYRFAAGYDLLFYGDVNGQRRKFGL
ncbi:unnamed protein product, partial [marine sediment metagenome]